MRHKIGAMCMVCGAALILSALSLFGYNRWEARSADLAAVKVLPALMDVIQDNATRAAAPSAPLEELAQYPEPDPYQMTEVEMDGYAYIGYLHIPALELELPVMSSWSDAQLKIAPCRYSGSVRSGDLVILAHNYSTLFGRIKELSEADRVFFTDMDGITYEYAVAAKDILASTAVEEMTAGTYDLVLFTCTVGGTNRVAIFCDRIEATRALERLT